MSEENEETPAQAAMRECRAKLFGRTPSQDANLEEIEKEFAQLQREAHHLRVWIEAFQLSTYAFVRQKIATAEETALFHGNILITIRKALFGSGATEAEVKGYLFGESTPDDDPAILYSEKCMEFAEKALEATNAMAEMHEASNPFVRMQRAADAALEKERKKTAN